MRHLMNVAGFMGITARVLPKAGIFSTTIHLKN